jgi:hypothetical protein
MNSSNIIQDTLHYELLRKFRTGNVIIDSFLHIFALGFLLNFITSAINAIHISYIFECFDDLPSFFGGKRNRCLSLKGLYRSNFYGRDKANFSNNFLAILNEIKKSCLEFPENNKLIVKLDEFISENSPTYNDEGLQDGFIYNQSFMPNQKNKFSLTSDIKCVALLTKNNIDNNKNKYSDDMSEEIEFKITLMSKTLSCYELEEYVNKITANYKKEIENKNKDKRFIFSYAQDGEWELEEMKSGSGMESIFFNDKDEIMKIILRFIKEKEFYKAVGKPYQIGFLLSGEPGCGKSSFIRALSNELNRSIKELKFNVIKDLYDLNKVMKCAEYKNIKMDCDKTIIVAEDVDACTDILYEREKHKPNSCNLNNPELMSAIRNYTNNDTTDNNVDTNKNLEGFLKEIEKNNSKNKSKNSKDENKPTLSDILNITDGINSNDGRIMIFTTNHPEKLDKALIRPGRLDYHIVFGKMRKNVLYDMITNWYKKYDELVIFNKADKADTKEESCYDKFISIWNEKNNEFIDEKLKPCDVACILQKYGKDVIYAINALIEKQTA